MKSTEHWQDLLAEALFLEIVNAEMITAMTTTAIAIVHCLLHRVTSAVERSISPVSGSVSFDDISDGGLN